MQAQRTSWTASDTAALYGRLWIQAAQRRYGFDLPTAQRLAFAFWLRLTGRLSDWESHEG
jgi:hypothetical protein